MGRFEAIGSFDPRENKPGEEAHKVQPLTPIGSFDPRPESGEPKNVGKFEAIGESDPRKLDTAA